MSRSPRSLPLAAVAAVRRAGFAGVAADGYPPVVLRCAHRRPQRIAVAGRDPNATRFWQTAAIPRIVNVERYDPQRPPAAMTPTT